MKAGCRTLAVFKGADFLTLQHDSPFGRFHSVIKIHMAKVDLEMETRTFKRSFHEGCGTAYVSIARPMCPC